MSLSDISIRRPVAMLSLLIGLTLLGLNAWRKMGLEFMPRIDLPYITVTTVYPGASPEELESDVAKKIEDAVGSVDGLKHITTSCMPDVCNVLLEFHLGVNVDVAATDVREKLDLIAADLPDDAEKPTVLKFDVNAKPIAQLALTGSRTVADLSDYADNELRDALSAVPGVADLQLAGAARREVQVRLDRDRLAARGLTVTDVVAALQRAVRTIPAGTVKEGAREFSVTFDAEYHDVRDLESLELAQAGGARCYLRDVGEALMTTEEPRQLAFLDGREAVGLRVVKRSDANSVAVVQQVQAVTERVRSRLPGGMELVWVSDEADFIRASVDSVTSNIWQAVLLTALILFLFLANWRSTLIVAVTMPLTIVISLFLLQQAGFTLNTSTMLALALSVGILVTNSIVVLESIAHRIEQGDGPVDAARVGAADVFVAVLASAGTNVVVLFPVAMMGSQIGLFFRPFALTMVLVTLVSLFISFTLTPLLAARFLRARGPEGAGRLERWVGGGLGRFADAYGALLERIVRRRWLVVAVNALVLGLLIQSLSLVPRIGMSFFAETDQGEAMVKVELPASSSLAAARARLSEVEARLADLPHLRHRLSTIGKVEGVVGQSSEGVHLAQLFLKFNRRTERRTSLNDLVVQAREKLAGVPDALTTVSVATTVGGQNTPVEIEIMGGDLAVLDRLALQVRDAVASVPGVRDPDCSVRAGKPELRVAPRRDVLADLGLPAVALGVALRGDLEGLKAATYKEGARSYDIRVKLAEEQGRGQVEALRMAGRPGQPLAMAGLAEVRPGVVPVQITRKDKQRVSKVYAQLDPSLPLGTAVQAIGARVRERQLLPPGYEMTFVGLYEVMQEGSGAFAEAGLLAALLTYLTLAAILESFWQPVIIFMTIPQGLIGILWALFLAGESLSMFALLGSVMLIGIVVNNAILIMDEVNHLVSTGVPKEDAMIRACRDQLRPVLMITLAAVLGMLPLALSRDIGAEMRTGIGIASIGGIAGSAILTLIQLPLLYELGIRRRRPRT